MGCSRKSRPGLGPNGRFIILRWRQSKSRSAERDCNSTQGRTVLAVPSGRSGDPRYSPDSIAFEANNRYHVDGSWRSSRETRRRRQRTRLQTIRSRHGQRFRHETHRNCNAVERVYREIKCDMHIHPNTFSRVKPETGERWLPAYAEWHT